MSNFTPLFADSYHVPPSRKDITILFRLIQIVPLALFLLMNGPFGCSGMTGGGGLGSMQGATPPDAQNQPNQTNEGTDHQNTGGPAAPVTTPPDSGSQAAMEKMANTGYTPNIYQPTGGAVEKGARIRAQVIPPQGSNPDCTSYFQSRTATITVIFGNEEHEETYPFNQFCFTGVSCGYLKKEGERVEVNYIQFFASYDAPVLDFAPDITQNYKSCPVTLNCNQLSTTEATYVTLPLQLAPPQCSPTNTNGAASR